MPSFEPTSISLESFESEVKDLLMNLKVEEKKGLPFFQNKKINNLGLVLIGVISATLIASVLA